MIKKSGEEGPSPKKRSKNLGKEGQGLQKYGALPTPTYRRVRGGLYNLYLAPANAAKGACAVPPKEYHARTDWTLGSSYHSNAVHNP